MTTEEYKRNLVRMFDSLRTEHKGEENCDGVTCYNCPFDELCNDTYGYSLFRTFETIEMVENWAKENPIKTNADKFKEVFGFKPFTNNCINGEVKCDKCECYNDCKCDANKRFWNAEYKEQTKE